MSELGMSKMESNEIMDTNMEETKMCSVDELTYPEKICIVEQK